MKKSKKKSKKPKRKPYFSVYASRGRMPIFCCEPDYEIAEEDLAAILRIAPVAVFLCVTGETFQLTLFSRRPPDAQTLHRLGEVFGFKDGAALWLATSERGYTLLVLDLQQQPGWVLESAIDVAELYHSLMVEQGQRAEPKDWLHSRIDPIWPEEIELKV